MVSSWEIIPNSFFFFLCITQLRDVILKVESITIHKLLFTKTKISPVILPHPWLPLLSQFVSSSYRHGRIGVYQCTDTACGTYHKSGGLFVSLFVC